MQHAQPGHAHRDRATLAANQSWLRPNSATARRGKAKTVPWAVPPAQRAEPLRATWCERLPALCLSRPALRSRNDKAAADFVFDPARVMSPKKLCALYASRVAQAILPAKSQGRTISSPPKNGWAGDRHFLHYSRREDCLLHKIFKRCATSSAFSRLLNAEIRKWSSPCAPKPAPGVMTTFSWRSIRSNICQLVSPPGIFTQIYGAFIPPKVSSPASAAASRRSFA